MYLKKRSVVCTGYTNEVELEICLVGFHYNELYEYISNDISETVMVP